MRKWPLYIGVILVILNCISWIHDPTVLPDSIRYGGIAGAIGAAGLGLIGGIFIIIYLIINRKK